MIKIAPITQKNAFLFKTVRICGLQDTPHAFGATYAKASQFADVEWLQRVERMNGERGVGFLAMDGDGACGILGAFLDSNDGTQAQPVSMWTVPTHRHRGISRLLVNEVLRWGHLRGASALLLMVTSNNEPAMRFYERLGFTRTGRASRIQTILVSSNTKCCARFLLVQIPEELPCTTLPGTRGK